MAALTTERIIQELNNYFDQGYPYVFWYDPKHEFRDIISDIAKEVGQSTNVKLYVAQENQQFKTKLELLNDPDQKYVVYAPYAKPQIEENFLTDMEHYSKLFSADATQIILEDLGLDEQLLPFVKTHKKYFDAKARRNDFKKYWIPEFAQTPEKGILAAIAKTEKLDINKLLMNVIEKPDYLFDFTKYGVLGDFWKLMEDNFGYKGDQDINQLVKALFFTYLATELKTSISGYLAKLVLPIKDNVQIFIDWFADSNYFQNIYEDCSSRVWKELNLHDLLVQESLVDLTQIRIFKEVNQLVLAKLRSRFDGKSIENYHQFLEIIDSMLEKTRANFDPEAEPEYKFLKAAAQLLNMKLALVDNWQDELKNYLDHDYLLDTIYRKALLAFTKISTEREEEYLNLKTMIDRYYSNKILAKSVKQWNDTFDLAQVKPELCQERFFYNHVEHIRERTVVIFSDALRYEVAKELEEELNKNDRLNVEMKHALTSLPSVTYLGMNVMLPHRSLEWDSVAMKVKVDGKNAENVQNRKKILQTYNANNDAISMIELAKMSSTEVKSFITRKNVIYVYHNVIDNVGHDLKTTKELVDAAEKAIEDLKSIIQTFRTVGVSHIIVTADHGFLYQERELDDADRIDLSDQQYQNNAHLRYLISPSQIEVTGVKQTTMGESLNNGDPTNVYYPASSNLFIARGGSKNYVHGGASVQEMLIPILDIKASMKRSEARPAEIKLAATTYRINSLKMNLLFNQVKAVSGLVRPTNYYAYFVDDRGMQISNKVTIVADRTGSAADRTIVITITIQKADYDISRGYWLVIEQENAADKTIKYRYEMDPIIDRN